MYVSLQASPSLSRNIKTLKNSLLKTARLVLQHVATLCVCVLLPRETSSLLSSMRDLLNMHLLSGNSEPMLVGFWDGPSEKTPFGAILEQQHMSIPKSLRLYSASVCHDLPQPTANCYHG